MDARSGAAGGCQVATEPPDSFCDDVRITFLRDSDKFVTGIADDAIVRSRFSVQRPCKTKQAGVADVTPEPIVDPLGVVEVEEQQGRAAGMRFAQEAGQGPVWGSSPWIRL